MPSSRGGFGGFLQVRNLRSLIKISPPESKIIKDRGIDFPNLFRSPGQGRGIFLKTRNLKSLLKISPPVSKILIVGDIGTGGMDFPDFFRSPGQGRGIFLMPGICDLYSRFLHRYQRS